MINAPAEKINRAPRAKKTPRLLLTTEALIKSWHSADCQPSGTTA
jgi:hypothetical protein